MLGKSRKKVLRVSEQTLLEAQSAIVVALSCLSVGDLMGAAMHAEETHQLAQKVARELYDQVESHAG